MVKVIPAFWEQFGDVGYSEPGGGLTYHTIKQTSIISSPNP